MNSLYEEVDTNNKVSNKSSSIKSTSKQVLICSSIWIQFFMAGMCVGTPTVMVPQLKQNTNSTYTITDELSSWIFATPSFSMLPWIMLPLFTKRVGRKIPQIIGSINSIIAFVCLYLAYSPYIIIVAEFLQGYVHGSNLTISIIIVIEYSCPRLRGMFLTMTAAAFYWGIWTANVIGTFFHWKNIALLGLILSLYTLTVFWWPESPYWLASRGRFNECKQTFRQIYGFTAEEELELLILAKEENLNKKSDIEMTVYDIVRCPNFYRPMILAVIAVLQYHFSGKMICSMFILDIFRNVTRSEDAAYIAMLILNGVTVVSMYVGSYLANILKRRTLYLSSSFIGVTFLLLISLYIFLCNSNLINKNNYFLAVLLTVYSIAISCGPMILSMSIYGELFSTRFQSGSYIIISIVIAVSYSVLVKLTPTIFSSLGLDGSFLLYGIICGLCTLYLYKYLPETKDKTQWEIEEYFRA